MNYSYLAKLIPGFLRNDVFKIYLKMLQIKNQKKYFEKLTFARGKKQKKFELKKYFLNNVSILGQRGYIISQKKIYADLSYEFPENERVHKIYLLPYQKKKTIDKAIVCTLPKDVSHNYFHWMTEVVPRLLITQKNKGTYILPPITLPFQKDIITAFKIKNYIQSSQDTTILAKKAICTYISPTGNSYPPEKIFQNVKEIFVRGGKNSKNKRIYISRKNATLRKIINEDELISFLKKEGFQILHLEHMSLKDQATAFNAAELIIGPHGAGFTNLMFCNKNVTVVEIMPPYYKGDCYQILAKHLQLSYNQVQAKSEKMLDFLKDTSRINMIVNIDKIKKLLKKC